MKRKKQHIMYLGVSIAGLFDLTMCLIAKVGAWVLAGLLVFLFVASTVVDLVVDEMEEDEKEEEKEEETPEKVGLDTEYIRNYIIEYIRLNPGFKRRDVIDDVVGVLGLEGKEQAQEVSGILYELIDSNVVKARWSEAHWSFLMYLKEDNE